MTPKAGGKLRSMIEADPPTSTKDMQALALEAQRRSGVRNPVPLRNGELPFYGALAVIARAKRESAWNGDGKKAKKAVRFKLNRKATRKRLERLARKMAPRKQKPDFVWD